jgi:formiminotetrahydrofolate cyclodeaminase
MTQYLQAPLANYLSDAASGEPTPGGGSVAALAGALAASMASMVGAFTLSSKRCAEHHEEAGQMREALELLRSELSGEIQADVNAFSAISEAYAMPKGTDEEKEARRRAIREASSIALQPPLRMVRALRALAGKLPRLAEIGNRNLVTDTGVAAHLCGAACRAASLNVRINLAGLGDPAEAEAVAGEIEEAQSEVDASCQKALRQVEASL